MHILILHGVDGHPGIHWQGWLMRELEEKGHTVFMPELFDANHPKRFEWLRIVKEVLQDVPLTKLVIVGHSLGVVTALDFIEQADTKVGALISVAGFAEDYGAELNGYFMRDKSIDFSKVNANLHKAFVLYGHDDPYVPQETLHSLATWLDVEPEIIPDGGHLNTDAGYTEFPRLLELVDSIIKS